MTDIEDRLRAELAAFAERADPALIRPLRQPPVRARLQVPRVPGWLAPAAAAAAVAALAIVATFAGQMAGHRTLTGPGAGVVTGPVAGVPRYFLTLSYGGTGHFVSAVVRSSATGAALDTTRIPGLGSPDVSAAADGQTFLITAATDANTGATAFWRLRVGPGGRTVRLDRLPISVRRPLVVDGAALSPDGSQVAIAEQTACLRCSGQIQVRSLATGATRTWRTQASGQPWKISWSAGGGQIGFLWQSNLRSPPPRQRDGYRVLNVTGPRGDLLAARPVVTVPPNPGGDIPAAFVTPDGRGFITSSTLVSGSPHSVTVITKIIELSARTGRVQRVLYQASKLGVLQTYGNAGDRWEQGCTVLSLDRTGQHPLASCFLLGRFNFGTPANGRLHLLPGIPGINCRQHCRGPMWATAAW